MTQFQYDRTDIHLRYGRARKLPDETITRWLETISQYVPRDATGVIVDMGCGTGRFTKALSDHFSAMVYGIDPSRKMLTVARQTIVSPSVGFIQGSAEDIPLADGTADLVYLSMVYHHIQDKGEAVREFSRVLRAGAFLGIRTSTQESLDTYPWLRFFPAAREIELGRAPSRGGMIAFLRDNGFAPSAHSVVRQLFAESFDEYVVKISLRALSSLQAIPDEEFHAGMIGLKRWCEEQESGGAISEDIDLLVFRSA